MIPRISEALLSIAVASGLLLAVAPANAANTVPAEILTAPEATSDPSDTPATAASLIPLDNTSAAPGAGSSINQPERSPATTLQPEPLEAEVTTQLSDTTIEPSDDQPSQGETEPVDQTPAAPTSDAAIAPKTGFARQQVPAESASPNVAGEGAA